MYESIEALEKKFKITEFPLNVIVEPGNYCNLNCITCANDRITRPKGTMNIRLYKKIIDEIAEENPYTRLWLDFYGEPLLQKYKIYYMVDYAKRRGLKNISMNTNGTLLDDEMAEMLIDSGIDFVSIDCDGFTKEVYEKIRVNAKRDVTYRNIEGFLERKKELGAQKPIVEIKTMEMEENANEVDQIIDYWRNRGAWTTKRRLITWGGQMVSLSAPKDVERIACGYALGILAITWEGTCALCVMDVNADNVCGDVRKESIKEIWNRRNKEFVSMHMEHKFASLPKICQDCNDWQIIGEERWDEHGNERDKSYEEKCHML